MKYQDITILLVDDDFDHANLFKTNLQRKGITSEVKHFGNSFTLRKYLFDKNVDHKKYTYLMILDINIAGLDCKKLLENIDKEYLLKNLTIITLSEAHSRLKEDNTFEKGDYASLSKPLIQTVFLLLFIQYLILIFFAIYTKFMTDSNKYLFNIFRARSTKTVY